MIKLIISMNKKLLLLLIVITMPVCAGAQSKFFSKFEKVLKTAGDIIEKLPTESSTKKSSTSSNSTSTASRTYSTKQGSMTISTAHRDLKIKITRCEAAGNTVIIDLMFENVGSDDTDLYLRTNKAYDDENNIFDRGVTIKIGNTSLSSRISTNLPAEIPLKGRIQIEGVPESATMFKRIDFTMDSNAWGLSGQELRLANVPISREGDE